MAPPPSRDSTWYWATTVSISGSAIQGTSTILPMCALDSISRCAAAASASGNVAAIRGSTRRASTSGHTSRRSAAAIRPFCSTAPRAQRRAGERQPPAEDAAQVDGRHRLPRHAGQSAPAGRRCASAARLRGTYDATHDVEDQIDAAPAGVREHGRHEVGRTVIDGVLRAKRHARRALLVRPRRRQHPRPARGRQLDRRWCRCRSCRRERAPSRPDCSAPRSNTLVHTVKNVSGIAAASTSVQPGRQRQALRRRRDAAGGVAAAATSAHTGSPAPPAPSTPAADGRDVPRHLEPGNVAGAGRRRIGALPLQHVRPIDPGGHDVDEHLAGRRHRIGALGQPQDLRPSRFAQSRCNARRQASDARYRPAPVDVSDDGSRGDDSSSTKAAQRRAGSSPAAAAM